MSHKLPLYRQIKELLLREIVSGRYPVHTRLPTEAALAKQLHVAVGTLRKALLELEEEEILIRRQGSGTYIHSVPDSSSHYHFLRLERADGKTGLPTATVHGLWQGKNPHCAQRLQQPLSTSYWCIKRLRYLDQVIVACEEIWLPKARTAILRRELKESDLHESLYWFYRQELQFWISRVEDRIGYASMPDWAPQALRPGEGAGYVVRLAFDQHDRPAETSYTWFDVNRASYTARWQL